MRMSSSQTSNKRIHLTKNSYAFFTGDFNRYMPKNKIIPLKLALPEYIIHRNISLARDSMGKMAGGINPLRAAHFTMGQEFVPVPCWDRFDEK